MSVKEDILKVESTGLKTYELFVEERLKIDNQNVHITAKISKLKLASFCNKAVKKR